MLAEFRSVFADFGRPDQDVKRAAEPAALSGNDLVMHPLLRRAHLIRGRLAITAHSLALLLEARQDNQAVSQPLCGGPQARLRRINSPSPIFPQNSGVICRFWADLLPKLLRNVSR